MRYCLTACLVSLALTGCHRRVPPPAPAAPAAQAAPQSQPAAQAPARKRDRPAAPRAQSSAAATDAPALKLAPALSAEEQRVRNAGIDRHLANARRLLGMLAGKTLTAQQRESFAQVESFILQTEKTRSTDLVGAGSLAERAEVLALDLVKAAK